MRKFLIVSVLFLFGACGINEENRRNININLKDGTELKLLVFERKSFISEARTLMIYANAHSLKVRNCGDPVFKNFGDEVFFETVKQNDLPTIESGRIHLAIPQTTPDKPYCIYSYTKKDNGEWIGES